MDYYYKYLKYKIKYFNLKGSGLTFKIYFDERKLKYKKLLEQKIEIKAYDKESIVNCKTYIENFEILFQDLYVDIFKKTKLEIIKNIDDNNNDLIIPLLKEIIKYCSDNNCQENKLLIHTLLQDEKEIILDSIRDISLLNDEQKKRLKRIIILYKTNIDFINIKFFDEFYTGNFTNDNEKIFDEFIKKYKEQLKKIYKVDDVDGIFEEIMINNIDVNCKDLCTFSKKSMKEITIKDIIDRINFNIKEMIGDIRHIIDIIFTNNKDKKLDVLNHILLRQHIFKNIDNTNPILNIYINNLLIKNGYNMIYNENIIEIEEYLIEHQEFDTSVYYPNLTYYNINYFNYFTFCHEIAHNITLQNNIENSIYTLELNNSSVDICIDDNGMPRLIDIDAEGKPCTPNYRDKHNVQTRFDAKYADLFADIISTNALINKLEKDLPHNREEIIKNILDVFSKLLGDNSHFNPEERLKYNIILNDKLAKYFIT
jgi:hypothetical protein